MSSSSSVLWILGAAFTPAGAALGTGMYWHIRRRRALLQDGARAEGVVARLTERQMKGPSSHTTSTLHSSTGPFAYAPVIAWTTADGRAMETEWNVARPQEQALAVGAPVEVRYDPANPSRWTLPTEGSALWWLFTAVGALFTVLGLGFLGGAMFM